MKRVQLRPGRTVFVSSTLAEQGARAFAEAAFTRAEVEQMATLEPKHLPSVLVGANKTLQRTPRASPGARNTQARVAAKAGARSNSFARDPSSRFLFEESKPTSKRKAA